jgi:hypothetical protein
MLGFFTEKSLVEIGHLLATFALCSLIGIERQLRRKGAGHRTSSPDRRGPLPHRDPDRQRDRIPRRGRDLQGPGRRPRAHDGSHHLGSRRGGQGRRRDETDGAVDVGFFGHHPLRELAPNLMELQGGRGAVIEAAPDDR